MRTTLPLVITFIVGMIMLGEAFIPHWRYRVISENMFEWGLILAAAAFLLGGFADITGAEPVLESMERLGYPVYFGVILGVWKLLGALAIVAPGTGRLKEWAYAGIAFDLTGAAASHAFAGDPAGEAVPALVLLVLAAASYALRPTSRRL